MTDAAFSEALMDPARPAPDWLTGAHAAPAGRRFDVYRNNVIVSLMDAMETGFPVIARLIGAENFRNLARGFVAKHPPRTPLMMHYGAEFPAYLAAFKPLAHLPYLADCARLELAMRASYHAADTPGLDPTALTGLAPERLMAARLRLAPAVRVLSSPWPIGSIRAFNLEPGAPNPEMRPEDILIVRPEFDPSPVILPAGCAAALTALGNGASMGEAFADLDETAVGPLISACLSGGAFTEISEDPC